MVAARTDPTQRSKGISLFLVDTSLPGFERGTQARQGGPAGGGHAAELFFDEIRLPADAMLGEPGTGFVSMMERLPQRNGSAPQ